MGCAAKTSCAQTRMGHGNLERVKGIEPSYEAWEAAVLPLNYTRICNPLIQRVVDPSARFYRGTKRVRHPASP